MNGVRGVLVIPLCNPCIKGFEKPVASVRILARLSLTVGAMNEARVPAETTTFMTDFLRQCGGYGVIDGGLATELERHGADLNDPLWSAKCLVSSPHIVRRVLSFINYGHNKILNLFFFYLL